MDIFNIDRLIAIVFGGIVLFDIVFRIVYKIIRKSFILGR